MTKLLFTGILSAVLVAGILSMHVPNALATILEDPFDDCINNGNSALSLISQANTLSL